MKQKTVVVLVGALGMAFAVEAKSIWIPDSTGGWSSESSWQGGVPVAGDTVEVPDNCDMPVTDADMELAGCVAEIVLSGTKSRVVFTLDSADATLGGKVSGQGTLVKNGAKCLALGSTGEKDYYMAGGIEINAGRVKCPQAWDVYWKNDKMYFRRVFVAEGAEFYTCGQYCTTVLYKLEGKGTVLNNTYCTKTYMGWPLRLDSGEPYSFEGTFSGYIFLQFNATVDLLSTQSSSTGGADVYLDKADVGLMTFGNGGSRSSIGLTYNWWDYSTSETVTRIPVIWNSKGRLRYLGMGETTDRLFRLNTCYPATIDCGTNGLLTLTGKAYSTYSGYTTFVLEGSNTVAESVYSGAIEENGDYSTCLVKRGPGTWRLAHSDARQNAGLVAVEDGTLRVDTLAEAGTPCSLGLSTRLREPFRSASVTPDEVDYAVLLGSAESEGRFEFTGKLWDNGVTNRPIAVTGRGGRIVSDGANRCVGFKGAFAADADGATLTLDGSSANNYLYDATDTHGPLSIAKEGSGTWILAGDQTFSGKLAVKAGTLVVSAKAGKRYAWYRFTVTKSNIWAYREKNPSDKNAYFPRIREIMLFNANGARINNGLTAVGSCTVPTAGQVSIWNESDAMSAVANAFDHNPDSKCTGWCGAYPSLGNSASWIPFVMHLDPDTVGTAATYDMLTNEYAGNPWDMQCWRLEASADGIFWDLLSEVNNDEPVTWANKTWFSSGAAYVAGAAHQGFPFGPNNGASLIKGTPDQLAHAAVSVAAGAVLKAEGAVTISKLEVASTGAGRIDGFAFADAGTVNLADVSRLSSALEIPMDITGGVTFSGWSVTLNGRHSSATASFANGKLKIAPKGLLMYVR